MKYLFAAFLALHGLIHLLGTAKGLGFAEIAQLSRPIDRPAGALWLVAAILLVTTAIGLFAWPQWWWAVGAGAVVVSQIAIVTSWGDARYGTIANAVIAAAVVIGFLSHAPWSLRAEYGRTRFHGQIRSDPDAAQFLRPAVAPVFHERIDVRHAASSLPSVHRNLGHNEGSTPRPSSPWSTRKGRR